MTQQDHPVRAKDADRDRALEQLSEAFADGQLDHDEYQRRSEAAITATHLRDLDRLVADLQPVPEPTPRVRRRVPWRPIAAVVVGVALVAGGVRGVQAIADHWPSDPAAPFGGGPDAGSVEANGSPWVRWSEVRSDLPGERSRARVGYPSQEPWRLDPEHVVAAIAAYRDGLGTPYLREATLSHLRLLRAAARRDAAADPAVGRRPGDRRPRRR